jgi:uncharacterized protein YdhG (YjbR/CyaY superfamily)
MNPNAKTIDEYLAPLSTEKRAALEKLRRDIHAAAPGAEETISYQMPAFRLNGRMLVWFGSAKHHVSFYPGGLVGSLTEEMKNYETSKGTIRFLPEKPLPSTLVRKIVKLAIARNQELERLAAIKKTARNNARKSAAKSKKKSR